MRLILFVCGTNRSRSPMAAAYFASVVKQRGIQDIEVASAGITVHRGDSLYQETRQVLSNHGLTPLAIGAVLLLPKLVRAAELIICMTDRQQEIIEGKFPSAIGKCRPLSAVLKEDMPIAEPAKGSLKDYENCLQSMIPALNKLAEIIE